MIGQTRPGYFPNQGQLQEVTRVGGGGWMPCDWLKAACHAHTHNSVLFTERGRHKRYGWFHCVSVKGPMGS